MVAAVPVRALQQEIFKISGRAIVNVPKSDTQNSGGIPSEKIIWFRNKYTNMASN